MTINTGLIREADKGFTMCHASNCKHGDRLILIGDLVVRKSKGRVPLSYCHSRGGSNYFHLECLTDALGDPLPEKFTIFGFNKISNKWSRLRLGGVSPIAR